MCPKQLEGKASTPVRFNRALAIPVTYLMLFVALITIISATYSFAIIKINAKANTLKASLAKQSMQQLDDALHDVAWSTGASKTVYFDEYSGSFQTFPSAENLQITIAFTSEPSELALNGSIGKVAYRLQASEYSDVGLFIKGNSKAIVNQSLSMATQLYVEENGGNQQVTLCYRPYALSAPIGSENGKPLNLVRIYLINLSLSQSLLLEGEFNLKTTSTNVEITTKQYELNQTVTSVALTGKMGSCSDTVWLPISSNLDGAFVELEILVCNICIEKAEA
ncbi:hypothetical protein KEJ15_01590 [Candidatus Bathyarchaeota archaeon]|nr:hypothetical protein [Candidatus Bathyarchaeota archaeon]